MNASLPRNIWMLRTWLGLGLCLALSLGVCGCGDRPSDYIGDDDDEQTDGGDEPTGSAASCSIASVTGTSGDITINFSTTDSDGDTVTVYITYSTDTGATFTLCTSAASNTYPNGGSGLQTSDDSTFIWDSAADVGTTPVTARVRITVADPFNPAGTCDSEEIQLNGGGGTATPSCAITSPAASATLKGAIPVTYTLTDSDDATTADIAVEFSTDGGTSYTAATEATGGTSEGTTGLSTSTTGAIHTFEWDSLTDVPDQDTTPQTSVRLRITPSDADGSGSPCESEVFAVDGSAPDNTAPTCTIVNPAGGETLTGDVTLDYSLADAEQTTGGSIEVGFSTDSGLTYAPATERTGGASEGTAGLDLSPAGTAHIYVWDSSTDVPGQDTAQVTGVRLRLQPSDGVLQGSTCETADFNLEAARSATGLTVMSQDGTVTFNDVACCTNASPVVLVSTTDAVQLMVEASFSAAPVTEDVTSAPGSGTITYAISDPTVATVDGAGLVTASATGANACTTLTVTFTPDGVTAVGAPQVQEIACCVDLGGSNDSDADLTTNAMRLGPDGTAGTADDVLAVGDLDADLPGTASAAPVGVGGTFPVVIMVNTGADALGAYAIDLLFDETVINIDQTVGTQGVETSTTFTDITLAAVNPENPSGRLRFNGFSVAGTATGIFDLATTHWVNLAAGSSYFNIHVCNLATPLLAEIGPPTSCTDPTQPPGEGRQAIAGSGVITFQ